TQENAGESYNASALGGIINETWKSSLNPTNSSTVAASWYPQYLAAYLGWKYYMYQNNPYMSSEVQANAFARQVADIGRLVPGTSAFDAAALKVRTTAIK